MERICSRCGEPAGVEDRFCARCGAPLSAEAPSPAPATRRRWWPALWIWVPLAAVVAVLILTNPSRQAYSRWLASQSGSGRLTAVVRAPAGDLAAALARSTLAQNDVIFTIFDTRLRRAHVDVLGILDHFVPLGASPID